MAEHYLTKDVWEEFDKRFELFCSGVNARLGAIERKLDRKRKTPGWFIMAFIGLVTLNLMTIGVFATLFSRFMRVV